MEDAVARRERLKALRAAAEASGAAISDQQAAEEPEKPVPQPVLKFRNYAVQDKKIEHEKVAPAQPPKFEEPTVEARPEDAAQEELIVNLAPKKANWDLKREIQPKLDKLERRTLRSLIEMAQEEERARLEEEGGIRD